ncbi:hypothetical protein [Larkinella terrae]|uniref:Uncharacterized protein n=1 Tax=Larkinella terrae TaxID=2025311 RepID=A0A7K0EGV8_9BACT|nr:hypothetical protein [Larkinella terrae]MRS60688.1 hypothetical protein [Larkinella terrae]
MTQNNGGADCFSGGNQYRAGLGKQELGIDQWFTAGWRLTAAIQNIKTDYLFTSRTAIFIGKILSVEPDNPAVLYNKQR